MAWVAGYERAWRAPGTAALGELFAEDATYQTAPFEAPYRGLAEIASMWEAERKGPDEAFTFDAALVALDGSVGVVRVAVEYGPPQAQRYLDLWIVRFDADGRCAAFEEWPFWPPGSKGGFAGEGGGEHRA